MPLLNDTLFEQPARGDDPQILPFLQPEPDLHNQLLYIGFYRKLAFADQKKFRDRIRKFVKNKLIVGEGNRYLPDNIRSFVAASAVQLTFGLKDWDLEHFHTIRIYPKEFYSRIYERYLKGGAGQSGVIWFSWKDYLEGYANQENGINLGLHEMGHALMINMQEGEQDERFTEAYEKLEELEQELLPRVRSGEIKFLRKYAGTNTSEFFAVSMEHFFEQPVEFKAVMPLLYSALSELLQQDPASGRTGSVSLTDTSDGPVLLTYDEEPKKRRRNFRFSKWHWSLTVLLLGIFIAPWMLIVLAHYTVVSIGTLWLVYFGIVGAGGILLYKKIVRAEALGLPQFVLFLFFGFAPVTLSSGLLINRLVPVASETEIYFLTGKLSSAHGNVAAELIGNAYSDDPSVREVPDAVAYSSIRAGEKMIIHFKRGLLGLRIHDYNEIIQ
jgi:Mlc titration factor MtfA (ptsG expression regulator)